VPPCVPYCAQVILVVIAVVVVVPGAVALLGLEFVTRWRTGNRMARGMPSCGIGVGTDEEELVVVDLTFVAAEECGRRFFKFLLPRSGLLSCFVAVIAHGLTEAGYIADDFFLLPIR